MRLVSIVYPAVWPRREALVAACRRTPRELLRPWRRREGHASPVRACGCGIYGSRDNARAAQYLGQGLLTNGSSKSAIGAVIGRVRLWGSVVEHQFGWRASRAYPAQIFVPAGARAEEIARGLAAAYAIPVAMLDCSMGTDLVDALAHV